jgi:hypothetical protein
MSIPKCFVIGPIGDKLAPQGAPARIAYEEALDVYEKVIVPACETNELEPIRADQIAVAGEITQQIVRHLREDDLVIADISGGNPNVMYELGLRHATAKATIQIGEYGQIPFDVAGVRTVQFSRSPLGLIDARKELERAVTAALLEGTDPLVAAQVMRGVANGAKQGTEVTDGRDDAATNDPEDELGLLEIVARIQEAMPEMTNSAEQIGSVIEQIGSVTEAATEDIDKAAVSANPQERMTLLAKYAQSISPAAQDLEERTEEFADHVARLDTAVRAMIAFRKAHPDLWDEDDFRLTAMSIAGMAAAGRDGMEGLNVFGNAAEGLGALSRTLRVPGRRISNSVRTMARSVATMDEWESALGQLLAEASPQAATPPTTASADSERENTETPAEA